MKKYIKKMLPGKLLKKIIITNNQIQYAGMAKRLKGENVYCPCCDTYFSSFLSLKIDGRRFNLDFFKDIKQDVFCPKCRSFPRQRIIADYLEKKKLTLSFDNVLIFSFSYPLEIWFTRNNIRYITADLFNKVTDIKADIQNIPFADNTFSFISCDHVLGCDLDYKLACRELFRVTKRGGICEITVPLLPELETTYEEDTISEPEDCKKAYGLFYAKRIFGMDFPTMLREIGFEGDIYGDVCDKKIVPITAPSKVDYNKVFICKKP